MEKEARAREPDRLIGANWNGGPIRFLLKNDCFLGDFRSAHVCEMVVMGDSGTLTKDLKSLVIVTADEVYR